MKSLKRRHSLILFLGLNSLLPACQKTDSQPNISGVAALTVVNAIPNSGAIIPIINTTSSIMWFESAVEIGYGNFRELSPVGGQDTLSVMQNNSDTLNIGPKAPGELYYNILNLKKGAIYSVFLCGTDTTSPDNLVTIDSLPYYPPGDSVVGIRFVNLSTGSDPISINLEGNANGSEVEELPYKGITGFKTYPSNAETGANGITFVFRDAATGDSLTYTQLINYGNGVSGLTDPNSNKQLTFKNITLALIGQPGLNALVPQSAIVIDNY